MFTLRKWLKFNPKEVVLYQYEACPFCNKVKAFLDFNKIPCKIVEVNPISKKEIKWSDYKKVPILTVDGEQLVDSSGLFHVLSLACVLRIWDVFISEGVKVVFKVGLALLKYCQDELVFRKSPKKA